MYIINISLYIIGPPGIEDDRIYYSVSAVSLLFHIIVAHACIRDRKDKLMQGFGTETVNTIEQEVH